MIGPNMFRTIYGELGTLQEKAHLIRYYQMPRHNIPAAIELMGEIDALSDDVNLTAVAPVAHEQMGMITGCIVSTAWPTPEKPSTKWECPRLSRIW